ncbi:unnamed protein product [Rotaria socialis]|uniref:HMG box domain-containing protein n=1 Tax=Rotaria socialis TaxID=392032 RepID=A0A821BNG4_9BILA|nr:unnamed protein product [Rotaria socialis]CAF4590598.1 unnamed protein product [Rotaria socialis]
MPRNAIASKKTGKDPNAPKRTLSAFFIFAQDERPDIKKESPSFDDSTKRYAQKAAVEKQKYEVCLVEYKKGGDDVSSAKGGKAAAKAPASKKPASKSKSSDEDNDDDDDNENEDEDEDEE